MSLLPDGLLTSPYEVLEYRALLVLEDGTGKRASFRRMEKIRFLQGGVSAILENVWGEGASFDYFNSAGPVVDSIVDGKYRHMVIDLGRQARKGEKLELSTSRTLLGMFIKPQEWWQIGNDHPARQISQDVVFPKERPCREASLDVDGAVRKLNVEQLPGGRTAVRFELARAQMNSAATVQWAW